MVYTVHKRLCGFLGKVDIAAHIGILKAELSDLAVLRLIPLLGQQGNFGFHLGFADRTGLILPVDFEYAHRETAFGRGVNIDQLKVLVVNVIGGLAADKQHPQEGSRLVAEHTHIGRGQKGDGDPLFHEEHLQRHRVLDGGVADNKHLAAANAEQLQDHDNGSDKVHGREQRHPVLAVEGILSVETDGLDRPAEIAVLVQHTLGIARGSRGVNSVGGVVVVCHGVTALRLCRHQLVPAGGVQLIPAAAVGTYVVNTVGRVGILHQRPRRARLPYADHRDDGHYAARQVDQHKVLFADPLGAEVGIDPAAHVIKLGVSNSLRVRLVIQYCGVWLFACILLQKFNNVHSHSPTSYVRISSKPVTSKTSFTAALTFSSFISPCVIIFFCKERSTRSPADET